MSGFVNRVSNPIGPSCARVHDLLLARVDKASYRCSILGAITHIIRTQYMNYLEKTAELSERYLSSKIAANRSQTLQGNAESLPNSVDEST